MPLTDLVNLIQKENEKDNTSNLVIKILSIFIFLAMAMGFGVMPHFIYKCRTSTKFLSLSNAFSGGLFLGIGLFHVLPESAEMLQSLSKAPIAYFMAFLSYALILFVEKVAFNSHALLHGHGHCHEEDENNASNKLIDSERETENPVIDNKKDEDNKEKEKEKETEHEHEHEHEHDHEHEHKSSASGITPYILLLALGFHGFFEGMALGIQTEVKSTLSLFFAIAAHKWAASLTLGISFVKAGVERNQLIYMVLIFALIGPVGIVFGLILSQEANETVQGIFLAISVGTFIYIACSEVLVEEFGNPNNKYFKFIMFMVGGIFIAGLALLELVLDVEE